MLVNVDRSLVILKDVYLVSFQPQTPCEQNHLGAHPRDFVDKKGHGFESRLVLTRVGAPLGQESYRELFFVGWIMAGASRASLIQQFSESLQEMGDCLLEKTALTDDEDSGRVLLMLGKAQLDIQKLVDNYVSC
ncbi:arfaptin homology domain/BAR domain-containing protein [Tanacetum coccineum]